MPEYRVIPGSIQDKFGALRTKVQVFGGGYGNGKTAAACVQKALRIAKEYPGANILIARATYPKLNDTIRKEFLKWCPASWIARKALSKNSDNVIELTNGTVINFRYVSQQGRGSAEGEQTTSNLLSATYDLIIVDQLEDPEITEKDFNDLLGRLRGNARYSGSDASMPTTGPRWFVACVNPTRNWVYKKLIAPLKKYEDTGVIDDDLLCARHSRDLPNGEENPLANRPLLDAAGKPQLLISLVEGSTYTNAHNLGADFIQTLESAYTGQQRDRFLYGEWKSYEGLVYPAFDNRYHVISDKRIIEYFNSMIHRGMRPQFVDAYDFGIVQPSCYLLAFTDRYNNIFVTRGFYEPSQDCDLEKQKMLIFAARRELGVEDEIMWADPAIYKKTQITRNTGAKTIAQLLNEGDFAVRTRAADNDILRGITKVSMYLAIDEMHRNPFTEERGAPHIYFSDTLPFIENEFNGYYWKLDKAGQRIDEPVDKDDHAMDTLKYLLSKQPDLAIRTPKVHNTSHLHSWSERNVETSKKAHRYG